MKNNFSILKVISGKSEIQQQTDKVRLRGSIIESESENNLNMIFMTEMFDSHDSWAKFFLENKINKQRKIYILNPRNFSSSDRHESLDVEEMTNDVIRFMDENKIKEATVSGHGWGGKLALSVGCYHSSRVTGVCVIDSGPLDHRYYESQQEVVEYLRALREVDLKQEGKLIREEVKRIVECPKWRKIFQANLIHHNNSYDWNFDMKLISDNLIFNKEESLAVWNSRRGLFTGKVCFIFPDQSRWVHLNTNTLAMFKVCAKLQGYGRDVLAIQSDDSSLNHWVYDFASLSHSVADNLNNFLYNYDGTASLTLNRQEMREQSTFMSNYTHRNLKYPGEQNQS